MAEILSLFAGHFPPVFLLFFICFCPAINSLSFYFFIFSIHLWLFTIFISFFFSYRIMASVLILFLLCPRPLLAVHLWPPLCSGRFALIIFFSVRSIIWSPVKIKKRCPEMKNTAKEKPNP